MNVWTYAAFQNLLVAAVCGLVIWFHHEWYWIVAMFLVFGLFSSEAASAKTSISKRTDETNG